MFFGIGVDLSFGSSSVDLVLEDTQINTLQNITDDTSGQTFEIGANTSLITSGELFKKSKSNQFKSISWCTRITRSAPCFCTSQ